LAHYLSRDVNDGSVRQKWIQEIQRLEVWEGGNLEAYYVEEQIYVRLFASSLASNPLYFLRHNPLAYNLSWGFKTNGFLYLPRLTKLL
jgi:hypothetical protein